MYCESHNDATLHRAKYKFVKSCICIQVMTLLSVKLSETRYIEIRYELYNAPRYSYVFPREMMLVVSFVNK